MIYYVHFLVKSLTNSLQTYRRNVRRKDKYFMALWNSLCDECGKYCNGIGDTLYYLCHECYDEEFDGEDD